MSACDKLLQPCNRVLPDVLAQAVVNGRSLHTANLADSQNMAKGQQQCVLTLNSSWDSSKLRASRLPWMWDTPVALGMTLVPFWMAHLIRTCKQQKLSQHSEAIQHVGLGKGVC